MIVTIATLGAVATLLASWLKNVAWSTAVKSYVAVGCSLVLGLVAVWIGGVTNWADGGAVVLAVAGASQTYYTLLTGSSGATSLIIPGGLDTAIATKVPSPLSLVIKPAPPAP